MLRFVSFRSTDHVFVVRTWLESPGDTRTMRGRIDHAATGRRRYFANFGELCDFIASTQTSAPAAELMEPGDEAEPQ
jgi:hypothetical protein